MTQPTIEQLLEDGIVDEIVGRLKSGKEADIWIVRHAGETLAAKMYRDRDFRSFKNNALYKEGRGVQSSRTRRAMERGSKFGREADEQAWKAAEADALFKLHAHDVRVPRPVLFYEGVLLMHLVVDAGGAPAPRLIDVPLSAETARAVYLDLRTQVIRMLCADLIHGDLSPYNVLVAADGPTIIDFPQIVAAAANSNSERFFKRDLENIRTHLAGADASLRGAAGDADEIWHAYVRRELAPDFVPSGRPPRPPPQRFAGHRPPPHAQRPAQHAQPHPQHPHAQHPRPQQPHPQHPRPQQPSQPHPQHPHAQHPRPQQPHPQHPHAQHPRPPQPHHGQRPPGHGAPQPPQERHGQRPGPHGAPQQHPGQRPQHERPQHERPQHPRVQGPPAPPHAQASPGQPPAHPGRRHRFHRGRRPS